MDGVLAGKVAIITGAGRGIGRAHALAFAQAGAAVVVNDLGVALDGTRASTDPADDVVAEIRAAGGRAVADSTDITNWDATRGIVTRAVEEFGGLDIVVNNAGISRFSGRMGAISHADWAHTLAVNLHGTAALCHWAAAYWIEQGPRAGRAIVNTTSDVGLTRMSTLELPNAAYAASKAGIAALTQACAVELADLGVRANAIAPVARSRISEVVAPDLMKQVSEGFDRMSPENIAAIVVYLASPTCTLTGRVVRILGDDLSILQTWTTEHQFSNGGSRWTLEALDAKLSPFGTDHG